MFYIAKMPDQGVSICEDITLPFCFILGLLLLLLSKTEFDINLQTVSGKK